MSECSSSPVFDGFASTGGGTPDAVIDLHVTTTDDAVTFVRLADLPAAGDSVNMMLIVTATLVGLAAGQQGANLIIWQKAATSANGTQGNQAGVIGPDSYVDPVLAPWSTVGGGYPVGWGGVIPAVNVGTQFGVQIIGAIATTIRWDFGGSRILGGTATP